MKETCRFLSMIHEIRLFAPNDKLARNCAQDTFSPSAETSLRDLELDRG
jgi:hypothetical protein